MTAQPEDKARRGFRFPAGIAAELHHHDGASQCGAENLSRTGVLLVGHLASPVPEQVDITLKDRTGSHEVRLSGRVIRTFPHDDEGAVRIAIEFSEPSDAQRDGLEVLLARILEAPSGSTLDSIKPGTPVHEIRKILDTIPIAQRIALAARGGSKERDALRHDTQPAVLEALLRNSGIVLADARLIAASTYLMPGTLEALAVDSRFAADEELRSTIALNPKTPVPTSDRLIANLKPPQLRALMARPGISGAMRDKLFKKLTRN